MVFQFVDSGVKRLDGNHGESFSISDKSVSTFREGVNSMFTCRQKFDSLHLTDRLAEKIPERALAHSGSGLK